MSYGDTAARRATDLDGLEFLAIGYAAADVEHDLSQRRAQWHFNKARIIYLAHQAEGLGAPTHLRTCAGEPGGTLVNDLRHV